MRGGYMRSQYDPLVDGKAPSVHGPVVRLRSAPFGTSVPVSITWSATDRGSGVFSYELQRSYNGGAWTSIALPSRLSTSVSRVLLSGSYRFRVRARDRVGNWSGWVAGPTIRGSAIQETSTSTHWSSGWTTISSSAFSGGKARVATAAGANVRITTTARSLAWVTRRGPGRGLAQVYVDGVLAATIDLRADALAPRAVVFSKTW